MVELLVGFIYVEIMLNGDYYFFVIILLFIVVIYGGGMGLVI